MSDEFEEADNDEVPENAEALVFAKIVRYMADQLSEVDPEAMPDELRAMSDLYGEIADAFEATSGFEFSQEQALPLSHAFAMLEGGIRLLAEQANEGGHSNAAAKMEWAAIKAKSMTAELETSHLEGTGGIITLLGGEETADPGDNTIH